MNVLLPSLDSSGGDEEEEGRGGLGGVCSSIYFAGLLCMLSCMTVYDIYV